MLKNGLNGKCTSTWNRKLKFLFAGMLALFPLVTANACSAESDTWQYEGKSLEILPKGSTIVSAPAFKVQTGRVAVLVIQARLNMATGHGNYLQLSINGTRVSERVGKDRFAGGLRILNKAKSSYGSTNAPYFNIDKILTIFSTSFEKVGEDATYVLDVSDLINKDKPNEIKITNASVPEYFKLPSKSKKPKLVIGHLELKTISAGEAAASPLRKSEQIPQNISGKGIKLGDVEILASATGGIEIRNNNVSYFYESEFSRPGGGKNILSVDSKPGNWRKLKVSSPDAKTISIVATDASYQLTRKIYFKGGRVELHDTFENLVDRVIGVATTSTMTPATAPKGIYLGGVDGCSSNGSTAYPAPNPTVFYAAENNGLGITPEDTVLRLGLKMYRVGTKCHFLAHHFGLKPKASYTMRWAIYPEDKPSYWSFISQLREDWGVNSKVELFGFAGASLGRTTDEGTRTFYERRGMKYILPGAWWGNIYGFYGTPQEQLKSLRKPSDRVKRAAPDAKVIVKIQPMLSAACPAGEDPYKDSQIIGKDGKPRTWPTPKTGGYAVPEGWVRYIHVPVIGNSWQKQLEEWVDLSLTDGVFGGVYFDTFSYATAYYGRYTYDRWDGHTVDIDPKTGEVTRKYADLAIISDAARVALIKRIQKLGGVFLANDPPCTEALTRLATLRCNEPTTLYGFMQMHLSSLTPLGHNGAYVSNKRRNKMGWHTEAHLMDDIRHRLSVGCLYSYYSAPSATEDVVTKWMYPITPMEIGPGWVKGKERTVTMISGEYGWGPDTVAEAILFDENCHRIKTPASDAIMPTKNGVEVKVPEKGMAVIIRKVKKD